MAMASLGTFGEISLGSTGRGIKGKLTQKYCLVCISRLCLLSHLLVAGGGRGEKVKLFDKPAE